MWSNDIKDDVTDEDLTKAADLATELTDDELDDAMLGKLFRLHDFRSVNHCVHIDLHNLMRRSGQGPHLWEGP